MPSGTTPTPVVVMKTPSPLPCSTTLVSPVTTGTPAFFAACELLGLDPLYVANEGKLVAICPAAKARTLLDAMQTHPLGAEAAIIGNVVEDAHRFVQMETSFGGQRIVDWLAGEQLPRIC